jgi:hypothetical protein
MATFLPLMLCDMSLLRRAEAMQLPSACRAPRGGRWKYRVFPYEKRAGGNKFHKE